MAAPLRTWLRTSSKIFQNTTAAMMQMRSLNLTRLLRNEESETKVQEDAENVAEDSSKKAQRKVVDADTSIRYLSSQAFVKGYGDKPVWFHYRRNFKGQRAPRTRQNCIKAGVVSTASPCPVCRDEYLVLDSRNTKLLEQFISPYTGEILDSMLTGLCQKQQKTLIAEVMKAWDEGHLEMKLPFRHYDYDDYKS